MAKSISAAILGMAALFSFSVAAAQVRVIDSQPSVTGAPQPSAGQRQLAQGQSATSNQVVELYYQVQSLQREVQELRGVIEQQSHEIKRLKQQRMDDYIDLDRRINQLSQGDASLAADAPEAASGSPVARKELADYRAAIDLVLKQQDYEQGIVALKEYLSSYPSGEYAPNAKYWLGQIYLLQNQLEQSRQWFVAMLDDHPSHDKAPEAKFKLGRVYDLLGDKARARALLEEVAASGTSAAGLAREYLRDNFSS